MDGMTIGSLVASGTALLGLIGVIMKILGPMQERAKEDGVREQLMREMQKDIDGIGSKVNHLQNDHNKVNDKVIELESKVYTKLENIERLLQTHINNHNG